MGLRDWLKRRRLEKQCRRLLRDLFRDPALLKGTSLRPAHSSRCVFIDLEARGGELAVIRFGILRHPRPYAFSRQSHEVIEYYTWDLPASRIQVERGINLTRLQGNDSCD